MSTIPAKYLHKNKKKLLHFCIATISQFICLLLGVEFGHHSNSAASVMQGLSKPKRIRTAFSPGQLVQLEAAFDNNPYVVGQERRDLALQLNLTETQV